MEKGDEGKYRLRSYRNDDSRTRGVFLTRTFLVVTEGGPICV